MRRVADSGPGRPWLVPVAVVAALAGLTQLRLTLPQAVSPQQVFVPGACFALAALGPLAALRRVGYRGVEAYAAAMALAAVGLVTAMRLDAAEGSSSVSLRHGGLLLLGSVAFTACALLPSLDWLRRYKYTWLAATLLLMGLTAVAGQEVNGARLWLVVGPLRFQPSELAKVTLVVFLAAYTADRAAMLSAGWNVGGVRLPPLPYLVPVGLAVAAALAILLVQNDLGSALLLFGTATVVLWLATGDGFATLVGGAAFAAAVVLAARFVPRVAVRAQNWLDPWAWPQSAGYQQVQADYALASGGVLGSGLGRGAPGLVPFVRTDYVLAGIGEEWGLLGSIAVVLLLAALTVVGLRVSARCPDRFLRVLAAGLTVSVALQALIIVGGVVRLIPLTGLPLPFVSAGGSSLLINLAVVGLLVRIARDSGP